MSAFYTQSAESVFYTDRFYLLYVYAPWIYTELARWEKDLLLVSHSVMM